MTLDLKVVGGTIIDGTGATRFAGDVGIRDGVIVSVGKCAEVADRTLDAAGALVMPGFTDIHTHYDGQASWDSELAPSCFHGVTTAVMGSCGVGFAPCRKQDRQRLIELMEGVEDIPGTALWEGITWDWETLPEYMTALDRIPHSIDISVQVPHDALRVYVMGERAVHSEPASEQDVTTMGELARAAMEAGAVGFSTGRTETHRTKSGSPTPASEASERELVGIAKALRGLPFGVLQAVSDFDHHISEDRFDQEFDLLEMMAKESGLPMSLSLMQRDAVPNQWKQILRRIEAANREGLSMRAQVAPRAVGVLLGLAATFHPFMGFPSYKRIADLPLHERVRIMRDPEFKCRLLSEKTTSITGDGSPLPPLADQLLARLDEVAMRLYRLGETPNYEPDPASCLFFEASQAGVPVLERMYDALLEDEGSALLYFPLFNYIEFNLNNTHTMLTHPDVLPGLSDGGAHAGTVCDASFPTFLLTHWGRDREEGKIPLEKLVSMQARDTARWLGLNDRGTLMPGQRADINVVDFERLGLRAPEVQHDLPAGGRRLVQRATGYVATLVRGEVVVDLGRVTEHRPGRVARPTPDSLR